MTDDAQIRYDLIRRDPEIQELVAACIPPPVYAFVESFDPLFELAGRRPGLIVAEPAPGFRARVEAELADARRRALAIAPRPIVEHVRTGSRWSPSQVQTVRRTPGRCVGCGCDLDDRSPGCRNCSSRHAVRRHAARRANARSLAAAA